MPLATIEIRGKSSRWGINWHASDTEIEAMRADGIDVGVIENVIPAWVADLGLTRPFIVVQDLWNFKLPFSKTGGSGDA
ncbi:hypothetical protein [Hoeflea sp.]|uniref:hypothetical protein n=1 Tax=Hoeflea sp. TaxID=1940281 RepID=UPI003A8CA086